MLLGLWADPLDGNPLKTKLPGGRILPERKASGILPKRVGNEGLGGSALFTRSCVRGQLATQNQ